MSARVQVLRSLAELERFAPHWVELARSAGHALSDPDWCLSAAQSVHASGDLPYVVCVWEGAQLTGLAPLMLVRGEAGKRLEFVGARVLHEPAEVLCRDDQAAALLARHIASLGAAVLLSRAPSESRFLETFEAVARRYGVLLHPGSSGSPYIDCAEGWVAAYECMSSRVRNITRRAERALGRLGEVEVCFRRPAPEDAAVQLQEALAIELHSWKGRGGSAVLQRPALRDFFSRYALAASRRNELLIATLRLNGSAIAAQVASIGRNRYRQLKIAYDDRQSKYLPGLQLLLHTVRWTFDAGLGAYEFMGSEERWIREWTGKVRRHKTVLFYPYSLRGLLAFGCDGARRIRGRVKSAAKSRWSGNGSQAS